MNIVARQQLTRLPLTFVGDGAGGPDVAAAGERPTPVVQLLTVVRRRKWIIVGAALAALLLGLVVTLLMTPRYTASATLEIQNEAGNFTQVEGAEDKRDDAASSLEFYQTQYGLLEARSLATRVASDLGLQDSQPFFELFRSPAADDWFENGKLRPGAPAREQRIRTAGDILLEHVAVEPVRGSRLVKIGFTSPDPAFSKRVVDAWSVGFVRATLDRRYEATSYARVFLEQRLAQLRARIDASERALVNYAARQGIVNLPQASGGPNGSAAPERPLQADDLASLNQELARATADRVRAQSRLAESADATPEALSNAPISTLRQRRAEMAVEYAKLMLQFDPQYPTAVALRTQMQRLDGLIAREEGRVGSSLRDAYEAGVEREQLLQERVGALKTGLLDLRRRSIQYNIYQRDVDTNRQLYDALLQRYKEIGVAGGVGVNNISVVDRAETPERPSHPRVVLNLALALFAGLLSGGALAFILEQIDRGVTDPQEVEEAFGTPLIGTIPKLATGTPLEALADRKSALSEAYTSLRANLAFSTDHGLPRVLAVTSSRPAEGKTTTSYALALSIARTGRTAVLVDADMRSPSIHHLFEIENGDGLSNYLSGSEGVADLVRPSAVENLFVLTSGPHPPSAPELLSSERFERLLSELGRLYDHIVVDAPPVMGLADAPLVGSRVEGVVFVLESNGTHRSMASVAINRLRASNTQVIGTVLTKFDAKRSHFGYGYDYGYGYGYGDNVGKTA